MRVLIIDANSMYSSVFDSRSIVPNECFVLFIKELDIFGVGYHYCYFVISAFQNLFDQTFDLFKMCAKETEFRLGKGVPKSRNICPSETVLTLKIILKNFVLSELIVLISVMLIMNLMIFLTLYSQGNYIWHQTLNFIISKTIINQSIVFFVKC